MKQHAQQVLVRKFLLLSLLALALTACGHTGIKSEGGLANTAAAGGLFGGPRIPDATAESSEESLDQEIQGVKLRHKNFDIPVVYNKEVDHWIRYFTGPGRKHFEVYLERMGQMIPIMQPRLRSAGVPEDLIFLAMIESGFSMHAKSHASAVGPWQFMKGTGHMYDLQANWWVDERRDPIKATDAAIRYLSNLHDEFGSWELATAAYNSGEGRIRNAIARLKTKDFWAIARNRRALRRETKDYVPKMMAAAIIGKNAEQFGFDEPKIDRMWLDTEMVKISKPTNLSAIAKAASIDKETLRYLNPSLGRCCTPPTNSSFQVRVPSGDYKEKILAAISDGNIGHFEEFNRHVIRRGDSLSKIASRYKVPTEAILALNEVSSRSLKVGTELLIPGGGSYTPSRPHSEKESRMIASEHARKQVRLARHSAGKNHMYYTVKQGDTLYEISRRYAVRIEDIKDWNSISRTKTLRPGRRIKLYVRNDQPNT